MLNHYEKSIIRGLTYIQLILGCIFIPIAVKMGLLVIAAKTKQSPDFSPYYAAAYLIQHTPSKLYQLSAYADVFGAINPHWGLAPQTLTYIAPPTLALVLSPLGLLHYDTAFAAWSLMNVLLCWLFTRQLGTLADDLGQTEMKEFFQSCVIGLMPMFYIFSRGQYTLLIGVCFVYYLLNARKQNIASAAFWFAVLLQLRPQLFMMFFIYLAGCRQWRQMVLIILWSLAFVLIATCFVGVNVWLDYLTFLHRYSFAAKDALYFNNQGIINFAGILSDAMGTDKSGLFHTITAICFLCMCLFCLLWPWQIKPGADIRYFVTIAPLALFTCLYLNTHDILLALPLSLVMLTLLQQHKQARWLILAYMPASYMLGLSFVFLWQCRIILLILCVLSIYLICKGRYSPENPQITI